MWVPAIAGNNRNHRSDYRIDSSITFQVKERLAEASRQFIAAWIDKHDPIPVDGNSVMTRAAIIEEHDHTTRRISPPA
jgi:hypothetical protein